MNYYQLKEEIAKRKAPVIFRRVPIKERTERAGAILEGVGLRRHLYHKPTELSVGEQQRVCIARALVSHPSIVLADEPTGNLDRKTGKGILELLKRLNKERGVTLIVVTHDPQVARVMPVMSSQSKMA